jgi:DNA-binding NarL/FixJ family response regulator
LKDVSAQSPTTRVILLANSNEAIYRKYAVKHGVLGYILKSSPKELLTATIKIVSKGGYFFDPGNQGFQSHGTNSKLRNEYKLSNREVEVVQLIKDGYSSKAIANHLDVSFHTIESHRKNIYNKLNIRKVTELLKVYRNFDN